MVWGLKLPSPMNSPLTALAGLIAGLTFLSTPPLHASDYPQWRGPQRDGHSAEKGLLKEWPSGGPTLAWRISGLGTGYATPAVVGTQLFVMGSEGADKEFVQAFSTVDGHRLWSTVVGKVGNPDQKPPYPGARSTPTVDGKTLFALSSDGDLAALDRASGKPLWKRSLRNDFGGKPGIWAYAESPLVDGANVIITPGGPTATVVALDKTTGEVRWKCPTPEGDEAGYASASVVEAAGRRQVVQLLQQGLVGIDAATGELLWRFSKPVSRFKANIPSPLVAGDVVYAGSAGTGGGAVRLTSKEGKPAVEELYFESKLSTTIGGTVKVGNHLYGGTGSALLCFELNSGTIKWQERSLGPSSFCVADGRIYVHGENGEVALLEPSPEAYREKGRFTPADQPKRINDMEKAWAYPVVADGRLYLRDQDILWAYVVKQR